MIKGIGALKDRVKLENPTYAAGSGGTATDAFTEVETLWAGIEPISINGRFQNYAAGVNASHVVKIRRNTNVAIGSRFIYQTRKLYVRSEMIGDKSFQFFICEEVV